jgi:hypothetical protein
MTTKDKPEATPKKPKRSLDEQKADLERRILDRDCSVIVDNAIDALRQAKVNKDWMIARKIGDDLGVAICERAGDCETDYLVALGMRPATEQEIADTQEPGEAKGGEGG